MHSKQAVLMIALACSISQAGADESTDTRHPWLESDWRLSLGSFLTNETSKLSVAGEAGSGDEQIDFGRSLGLDDSDTRLSGTLNWRFGEKWSVGLQYLDSDTSSTRTLDHDIEWGDQVLQAGSSVSGGTVLEVWRVFFGRTFSTGQQHEFGAGVGLHWMEIGAFAEGEFFLNGASTGVERRNVSVQAPLPNIGAWYGYAFTNRWLAHARLDWFSASVDEYSGSLTNAVVGIGWQPWPHVGFGLDYNYFNVDVDVESSSWIGSVDMTRDGPFLHVTFDW